MMEADERAEPPGDGVDNRRARPVPDLWAGIAALVLTFFGVGLILVGSVLSGRPSFVALSAVLVPGWFALTYRERFPALVPVMFAVCAAASVVTVYWITTVPFSPEVVGAILVLCGLVIETAQLGRLWLRRPR